MKIAIHRNKGGFAEHWINYCDQNKINYKLVNCYANTIIQDIEDCDVLMFHPLQLDYKAELFFKQLLYSIQISGKKVFPDFNTVWHFDDKVGQKYLLESIKAPFVNTYVFYDKKEALNWANSTNFPKVFKLRGGAGSKNVRMAKTRKEAELLIKVAFNKGFPQYNKFASLKERIRKFRNGKTDLKDVLKGCYRLFVTTNYSKIAGREIGYIYFQDFIPNNLFDIRVIVIGEKAFAIKRMVRKNDFRASGSGEIVYEEKMIDNRCIITAFEVNDKLKTQCVAFDFVFDLNNNPLIIEISYGFVPGGYVKCNGYWDNSINFHEGKFNPYGWIIEDILKKNT